MFISFASTQDICIVNGRANNKNLHMSAHLLDKDLAIAYGIVPHRSETATGMLNDATDALISHVHRGG